jgi:5-deoxy-glucuronate isomerase
VTDLLVRGASEPAGDGCLVRVTPESAGWRYVGFEAFRLARGQRLERPTAGREVCAVVLSGLADVSFGGREWTEIGRRESVFDGVPPYAVHAPPGGTLAVRAVSDVLEIALCWAPAASGVPPVLVTPEDCRVSSRGHLDTERRIHDVLMEDRPAESLLITEVLTPAGHWSSYPPHKHDTDDPPRETYLEETYYHRLRRPDGFAVQLVYTSDRSLDAALRVRDGDVVLVPRGYHPVGAAPGCDLYYLNVMAGPRRQWRVTVDPAHHID